MTPGSLEKIFTMCYLTREVFKSPYKENFNLEGEDIKSYKSSIEKTLGKRSTGNYEEDCFDSELIYQKEKINGLIKRMGIDFPIKVSDEGLSWKDGRGSSLVGMGVIGNPYYEAPFSMARQLAYIKLNYNVLQFFSPFRVCITLMFISVPMHTIPIGSLGLIQSLPAVITTVSSIACLFFYVIGAEKLFFAQLDFWATREAIRFVENPSWETFWTKRPSFLTPIIPIIQIYLLNFVKNKRDFRLLTTLIKNIESKRRKRLERRNRSDLTTYEKFFMKVVIDSRGNSSVRERIFDDSLLKLYREKLKQMKASKNVVSSYWDQKRVFFRTLFS